MLKTIGRGLVSLLFPSHCELCGRRDPSREGGCVCEECFEAVPLIAGPHCPACGRTSFSENERCGACGAEDLPFDRAYACVRYDGPMKELLHGFKFRRKRYFAAFFSRVMTKFYEHHMSGGRWDIVPVPMDRRRRFDRGFNQSELLGARLAGTLGRPYLPRVLGCGPSKTPQSILKKAERKNNVRDRFFVTKPEKVRRRDILLVDDILTTGLTASACAKALKDAGARSVTVLAFARGI